MSIHSRGRPAYSVSTPCCWIPAWRSGRQVAELCPQGAGQSRYFLLTESIRLIRYRQQSAYVIHLRIISQVKKLSHGRPTDSVQAIRKRILQQVYRSRAKNRWAIQSSRRYNHPVLWKHCLFLVDQRRRKVSELEYDLREAEQIVRSA